MAVFILSDLLKQFMLNESQTYVGMVESRMPGRSKPYLDVKRNRPSKACFLF
ncbi:MAG: hypothetical protein KF775_03840 [Cyclobacteriaceae bacterium]|nr:hypothetical protein [Cyclobacteriaceae bacterium]